MARKTWANQEKGKPYSVEWPEWFVECAEGSCREELMLSAMGEASSQKEAEAIYQNSKEYHFGWRKINKFWFCPKHQHEKEQS